MAPSDTGDNTRGHTTTGGNTLGTTQLGAKHRDNTRDNTPGITVGLLNGEAFTSSATNFNTATKGAPSGTFTLQTRESQEVF
jgi:hypothetical protein